MIAYSLLSGLSTIGIVLTRYDHKEDDCYINGEEDTEEPKSLGVDSHAVDTRPLLPAHRPITLMMKAGKDEK